MSVGLAFPLRWVVAGVIAVPAIGVALVAMLMHSAPLLVGACCAVALAGIIARPGRGPRSAIDGGVVGVGRRW
jgi:hypothetical protein